MTRPPAGRRLAALEPRHGGRAAAVALAWAVSALLSAGAAVAEEPAEAAAAPPAATSSTAAPEAPAAAASSTVTAAGPAGAEILSVGEFRPAMSIPLALAFERFLEGAGPRPTERYREEVPPPKVVGARPRLADVEGVPAYYSGSTYRFRLSNLLARTCPGPAPAASTGPASALALDTSFGPFVLLPGDEAVMAAFQDVAVAPDAHAASWVPRMERRPAAAQALELADGSLLCSVTVDSKRPASSQWRKSWALAYRLCYEGRPLNAVFLTRPVGGLGRLASVLAASSGAVVVSRGSVSLQETGGPAEGRPLYEALEALGLKVSGVGLGELRRWDEVEAYRRDRPQGVKFLSANLVASSAPAAVVLPASAVVESGGLRIGFVGLTRMSYGRFMVSGRLKDLALADPVQAAVPQVRSLRPLVDVLVVLSNLSEEDNARVREAVRGVDVILGGDEPFLPELPEPKRVAASAAGRGPFDAALLTVNEFAGAVTRLSLSAGPPGPAGTRWLEARQSHILLDDTLPEAAGGGDEAAAVAVDTRPALIPSARAVFPERRPGGGGYPVLTSRDFWTMAAGLAAERTGSEAGLLPVLNIQVRTTGDHFEDEVAGWFTWDDALVTFELPGKDLAELLREAGAQARRAREGRPAPGGRLALAAGGLGPDGTLHGVPLDPVHVYKVASSELLLGNIQSYPALGRARNVVRAGDLKEAVLAELRSRAREGWTPDRYRGLMEGGPVRETPLWRIIFRDVSFSASNSAVVRPDDFNRVPNSRIQGFNQLLIGAVAKTEADYQFKRHRWANALEAEYSRARIRPRSGPEVVNTPSNRGSVTTMYTRRAGSFPLPWLARSFGPSTGLQAELELERPPGRRRKELYSVHPGVEFFDGSVFRTVELSGNFRRDLARDIPNTQYGLRARALAGTLLAPGWGGRLDAEAWANYFFLMPRDLDQDLRLEGDLSLKLHIPVYRHLVLSPFLDLYYFQLKVRPVTGYSAIMGVSLGFSRSWKPQYERF